MNKHISPTFIKNVKKSAKKLKKEQNINHNEALEIASKNEGFPSFYVLQKTFKNQNKPEINYVQHARYSLEKIVEGSHGISEIKSQTLSLSKYHDIKDIQHKILEKILDAFDNGINHDGHNAGADLALLTSGFNNDEIEKLGHSLTIHNLVHGKIKGYMLVAVCCFFRSVQDCFQSERYIHPNFEVYLADWIRSQSIIEDKVSKIISELYIPNDYVGFKNGATFWKPSGNSVN